MNTHNHKDNQEFCPNPDCHLHDPDKYKRYMDAKKEFTAEGYIKIHITSTDPDGPAGENLWAMPLDSNTAVIKNVPFFSGEYGLNDIVEIDDDREVIRLVQKMTETVYIKYDYPEDGEDYEATKKIWHDIFEFLNENGLSPEGMAPGYAVAAYDIGRDPEEIMALQAVAAEKGIEFEFMMDDKDADE